MSKQINAKKRRTLRNQLAEVFGDKIKTLPPEMRYILLDDLVTAFENRLSALSKVQSSQASVDFELTVSSDELVA